MGTGLTPEAVEAWAKAIGYILGDLGLIALVISIALFCYGFWKEAHR